jgi:hypothetical protein
MSSPAGEAAAAAPAAAPAEAAAAGGPPAASQPCRRFLCAFSAEERAAFCARLAKELEEKYGPLCKRVRAAGGGLGPGAGRLVGI